MLTERERKLLAALKAAVDTYEYASMTSYEREVTKSDREMAEKVLDEFEKERNCSVDCPAFPNCECPQAFAEPKRWPFVESPGEFAARMDKALGYFGDDMLAAVRHCLIENPPQIQLGERNGNDN